MNAEHEAMLDRAQRRTDWSARALSAAAQELLAAGEHGALTNGTAERLRLASASAAELVVAIEQDRQRSASERRARDAL